MKILFYKFWNNLIDCFKGQNLLWHLLAILATYLLVTSGFDYKYFQFFQGSYLAYLMFSAAAVGGLAPVLFPVMLLIFAKIRKNLSLLNTSYALGQAAILGALISSFYKAFTGRAHPDVIHSLTSALSGSDDTFHTLSGTDLTHIFKFGLFQGGIFWGWPSSHTTIAFAMAFTLWNLYPKNKLVRLLATLYALYIGVGVSMTIHWFSDFVAGAIIGTVIGLVVGKALKAREQKIAV